jgi:hypothetical protein
LEVVYKCKPDSFRSKLACGGERVELSCPNHAHRLAILNGTFHSAAVGEHYLLYVELEDLL